MSDTRTPSVRVVFVAGSGRSGSTVISNILGQADGCFAAGEMRYLWQRGAQLNQFCGCGLRFAQCPFWTSVMARLRETVPDLDSDAIGQRLVHRLRIRRLPLMLLRRSIGRPAVAPHSDDATLASLYQIVAERSGGAAVVDSSKLPTYGLLLEGLAGVDLTVLHLFRDPRAAAYSWLRRKENDGRLMQRQEVWKSSCLWLLWNLVCVCAWRSSSSPAVLRLRYEDFVRRPRSVMEDVLENLELDRASLPFRGDAVELMPTHSVAGNPNRHDTGVIRVRSDDEWRTAMPRSSRAVVTLITAPGLLRFRYPLRVVRASTFTKRGTSP